MDMKLCRTLALGLLLAPSLAHAGNEAHPRTPVLWPESECGVVIDRDEQPIVHFDYEIPLEDTQLGPDELPDSRTHQFFALCRQRAASELLPNWISVDDVELATMAGLIEPGSVPSSDVLDTSAAWADCFVRITADDDRRPITFAVAEQGFDWNLADAPLGVWQVAGYTFEPPLDLWRARPGFVKVVEDPDDPAQDLPAAYIASAGTGYFWPDVTEVELCVDVLEPATAIFEWAPFAPELVWEEFDRTTIEQDGLLTIVPFGPTLEPPSPGANVQVEGLLRVRVIDALDREYVAHITHSIIFERCNGHCGDGDPPPDDPPLEPDAIDDGCACSHANPGPSPALACLVLVIAATRTGRSKRRSR
jgi:hypothetical protein